MLFHDWKILSFLRLIVLLILSLSILSCGQNILGPENIPPPTDFYIPPDTIPGGVDIKPIPAEDGTVFGGFGKRFIYKGKWHILVDNIYKYNPDTKTLTKRSSKALIRLNDEKDISILGENLDKVGVRGGDFRNTWDLLNGNWNHNGAKLTCELNNSENLGSLEIYFISHNRYSVNGISMQKNVYRIYYYQYFNTDNLVNWNYESEVKHEQIIINYPLSSIITGVDSWNHTYGISDYERPLFKGYVYILGGKRDFNIDNPSGSRPVSAGSYSPLESTIKRIKVENALYGDEPDKWEEYNAPFGTRTDYVWKGTCEEWGRTFTNKIESRISYDENTLYIKGGFRTKYVFSPHCAPIVWFDSCRRETTILTNVWSTTDGVNWQIDTLANFNSAKYDGNYFARSDFPQSPYKYQEPLEIAPLEPDWAKSTKNSYYKMDNTTSWRIPVPYDEIASAADRGETNFVVTDEHKNSYNNFLISTKHPDKADNEDWKALKINNYTKSSMHWVSSPEYLFAFGDKLVRFVDYDMIDNYYNGMASEEQYDDLMKRHKEYHKLGENGGGRDEWGREISQRNCYFNSMYYKAQADVMSAVLHADIKDVYPDEAIRHYLLEFYH